MITFITKKSKSVVEKIAVVLLGFGTAYVWCLFISSIFKGINTISLTEIACQPSSILSSVIMSVIVAPFAEELIFRVGVVKITRNLPDHFMISVMIISSVIFGWAHGSYINVFFQGFIGFVLACVYVKNNYCYLSAVILHALWNLVILLQ